MKKRISSKIFILLLAMCSVLMLFTTAASADEPDADGYINGTIFCHISEKGDGCELRLCRVGEYVNGSYVLDEMYAGCGADMTNLSEASAAQAASEKFAEAASKTEDGDVQPVNDGLASFMVPFDSSVVYVLFQTSGFDTVKLSPALIVFPFVNESGEMDRTFDIDLKYELVPQEIRGSVILNKSDLGDRPLRGAVFDLEKMTEYEDGRYDLPYVTVVTGLVTDKNGQLVVTDLPLGKYRFVEKQAPVGFKINPDCGEFIITETGTVKLSNGIYVPDDDNVIIYNVMDEPEETSITHESHVESSNPPPKPDDPPVVTGEDIAKFIIIGVVVLASLVAVVLLVVIGRKKKDDDDDE